MITPLHSSLGNRTRPCLKKKKVRPGMVTLIPALLGAEVGGSFEPRSWRPAWATKWDPHLYKKIKTKIMWVGEHAYGPGYMGSWSRRITWAQEIEVQWAVFVPFHSILSDRERSCLRKEQKGINVICHTNRLKKKNRDYLNRCKNKKAFDKIQHLVINKTSQKTSKRRELLQPYERHLQKPYS